MKVEEKLRSTVLFSLVHSIPLLKNRGVDMNFDFVTHLDIMLPTQFSNIFVRSNLQKPY